MCASAIGWSGFKEYIYGTIIQHNYNVGWGVITLSSYDVFQQTRQLPGYQTGMLRQILTNETDPLFSWQYNESYPCPSGCVKKMSATRSISDVLILMSSRGTVSTTICVRYPEATHMELKRRNSLVLARYLGW
jgi:hypothetical protein